jgi:hypothetical protein
VSKAERLTYEQAGLASGGGGKYDRAASVPEETSTPKNPNLVLAIEYSLP